MKSSDIEQGLNYLCGQAERARDARLEAEAAEDDVACLDAEWPDFWPAFVQEDGRSLAFVPAEGRTPELCLVATEPDGRTLAFLPEALRTEAVLKAVADARRDAGKEV